MGTRRLNPKARRYLLLKASGEPICTCCSSTPRATLMGSRDPRYCWYCAEKKYRREVLGLAY
ncbi:hypothetical protein Mx9_p27 [Myxococcus phage Mx9]|nr:hypothetical protein Mx9_p27 [Myxococcus phage Mx9]